MKALNQHPGWSLVVAGVEVLVGIILICLAIVVVGAVLIGILFVLDNVAWGTIVGGSVIVFGVCCLLVGIFQRKKTLLDRLAMVSLLAVLLLLLSWLVCP